MGTDFLIELRETMTTHTVDALVAENIVKKIRKNWGDVGCVVTTIGVFGWARVTAPFGRSGTAADAVPVSDGRSPSKLIESANRVATPPSREVAGRVCSLADLTPRATVVKTTVQQDQARPRMIHHESVHHLGWPTGSAAVSATSTPLTATMTTTATARSMTARRLLTTHLPG